MAQLSSAVPIWPGMDLVLKFLRLVGTQNLTLSGSPTGGTLLLNWRGATTAALPYNATAAQIQAALEALPNIRPGNVIASGGPFPGTAVLLTPTGTLPASDWTTTPITATLSGLTGGANYALAVNLPVQDITGYTYALEARDDPGEPTPDISVQSARWTYADETARLAAGGFVAADVGQMAVVTADATQWRLTAVTPTWVQITPIQGVITNGGATGLITVTVNRATTAALDFTTGHGQAAFILAEIISDVRTAIITGVFALQPVIFT